MENITWGKLSATAAMIAAILTTFIEGLDLTVCVIIFMSLFLCWRMEDLSEQML